ncbi:UpxY family transcription antiterminator [Chitinophaga sp.]|uniref:UpxY family transcription antiterminator n=1 Tax=Chitinophaga sp. TaxID=1869181 RepID=UPI0031DA01B2
MSTCFPRQNWFVLYTRPKFEKRIAEQISKLNYESFLPIRTCFRKWSDRVKRIEEPLFPNYVFVRITSNDSFKLLSVSGVVKLITCEGKPVSVSESEIEIIKKIAVTNPAVTSENLETVGEKVRVISGAFVGMEGELIRKVGKSRLLIRLPAIDHALSVEIDMQALEKIA